MRGLRLFTGLAERLGLRGGRTDGMTPETTIVVSDVVLSADTAVKYGENDIQENVITQAMVSIRDYYSIAENKINESLPDYDGLKSIPNNDDNILILALNQERDSYKSQCAGIFRDFTSKCEIQKSAVGIFGDISEEFIEFIQENTQVLERLIKRKTSVSLTPEITQIVGERCFHEVSGVRYIGASINDGVLIVVGCDTEDNIGAAIEIEDCPTMGEVMVKGIKHIIPSTQLQTKYGMQPESFQVPKSVRIVLN